MYFFGAQLSSFTIPLKDLTYLICYYSSYYGNTITEQQVCLNPTNFFVAALIAFYPSLISMIQVYLLNNESNI